MKPNTYIGHDCKNLKASDHFKPWHTTAGWLVMGLVVLSVWGGAR